MIYRTELTRREVTQIIRRYPLELRTFKRLSGGNANVNYLVRSIEGAFVLSLLDNSNALKAENHAALLRYLRGQRVPTAMPVANLDGVDISIFDGDPVMVRSYIVGKCSPRIPESILPSAGYLLARINEIPAPADLPQGGRRMPVDAESCMAKFHDRDFVEWMQIHLKKTENITTRQALKCGLVHGDYYPDNLVLVPTGEIAVLDWEIASNDVLLLDIGVALIGLCSVGRRLDPSRALSFLSGYQEKRPLGQYELYLLRDAVIYAAVTVAYYRFYRHNIYRPNKSKAGLYRDIPPFVESVYANWNIVADAVWTAQEGDSSRSAEKF
jgi:Ser/Thr protein kinase RdoA (MazF antagonist)